MEDRPGYYAILPASVRYDNRLKPNEKLLYSEVTALSNKTGECYATNGYFAELYEVDNATVSRWLKDLKDLGYIEIDFVYKNGSKEIEKRVIKINGVPISKSVDTYVPNNQKGTDEKINPSPQKNQGGIDEKVKENNTSINNIYSTTTIDKNNTDDNKSQENIYELIEKNFGRTLAPVEYEKINSWENYNFSFDLLKHAVSKAVLNGAFNINYIDKVLYEWDKANIRTVVQAQKSDKEHIENKNKQLQQSKIMYKTQKTKTRQEREEEAIAQYLGGENV